MNKRLALLAIAVLVLVSALFVVVFLFNNGWKSNDTSQTPAFTVSPTQLQQK